MIEVKPKFLKVFLILVTLEYSAFAREEWVDPHDMNIRINTVKNEKKINDEIPSACNYDRFYKDKTSVHLKKVVGLINDMIYFDRRNNVYKGIIDIRMNENDYDFLRKYLSAELSEDYILIQLSEILERSFEKSIYSSYFFSIGELVYLMLFNENTLLALALIISLFILWKIQPHNYNLTSVLKLFMPIVYLADFVLRYRAKLEEAEVDQFLMQESYERCDPDNLSWFNWIYDKFTGYCRNDRREFLLSQRAATHIFTPLNVISDQFDIFVNIFKHLGAGLGSFMMAFIDQAPWYIKPILGLLSFSLVIIILLMMGSYIFDISPKMNLFYFIQLEMNKTQKLEFHTNQTPPDRISGENLRILLESKNQNNSTPLLLESTNQRKSSLPTFKTKSRILKKRKINTNLTGDVKAISVRRTNSLETDGNCEFSCDT